jgi:hypothetical protein
MGTPKGVHRQVLLFLEYTPSFHCIWSLCKTNNIVVAMPLGVQQTFGSFSVWAYLVIYYIHYYAFFSAINLWLHWVFVSHPLLSKTWQHNCNQNWHEQAIDLLDACQLSVIALIGLLCAAEHMFLMGFKPRTDMQLFVSLKLSLSSQHDPGFELWCLWNLLNCVTDSDKWICWLATSFPDFSCNYGHLGRFGYLLYIWANRCWPWVGDLCFCKLYVWLSNCLMNWTESFWILTHACSWILIYDGVGDVSVAHFLVFEELHALLLVNEYYYYYISMVFLLYK